MAQVIEKPEETRGAAFIKLDVYPKPKDPSVIFGMVRVFDGERGAMLSPRYLGVVVEQAYLDALAAAAERAIPFVWVNDPMGLFPPSKRPTG